MKKWMFCIGLRTWILLSGCGASGHNALFQTFTINALLAGLDDGDLSYSHLLKRGDFGIGTFSSPWSATFILFHSSVVAPLLTSFS